MNQEIPGNALIKPVDHNINLDFVRGVAALLVVMQHLQCFQFVFPIQNKTFNFFCSLGGDAVMVFFVLSGYLVGGSVVKDTQNDRWSWVDYLVKRLSRLWIVLIPALLLTVFWDSLGMRLAGQKAYHGFYSTAVASGPEGDYELSPSVFFGNVLFLQLVRTIRLGSNGPLWSLSYEFWYYIFFPLLYLFFLRRTKLLIKIFYIVICMGLVVYLPLQKKIMDLSPVWFFGVLAYWAVKIPKINRLTNNLFVFTFSFLLLAWVVTVSHLVLLKGELAKYFTPQCNNECCFVGISFALMIPFLASNHLNIEWYKGLSKWLSKISYTLYLVHYPLLAFFFFSFRLPQKENLDFAGYLLFVFYIGVVLLYSWGIWFLFERRTPEFRKVFSGFVHRFV